MSESKELASRTETLAEKNAELITIAPVVDIYENEDEILLYAEMPGATKETITVHVDNGKLEISGTRNLQSTGAEYWREFGDIEFRRVFSVPQSIDVTNVNAEFKDGTLNLHMPKAEAAKPRKIEIQSA